MPNYDRAALIAHARGSIRRGSKSFAAASRLFDRETRERVWLLYAWCRACDDLADAQDHGHALGPPADAASRLATIRALTGLALAGEPTGDPAFDALGLLARETPITRAMADDVIAGFALDAADWRPRGEADMLRYCFHVAGAVGVMMAAVMDVAASDDDTLDRACDLGIAFQLANIVRDIREDAAAGRCYLPGDWLAAAHIAGGGASGEALAPLVARACALARGYEASARIGAARLGFRQRWAVLAAANIYGAIGREVERRGPRAWDQRVHTSRMAKLGFVARAFTQALRAPRPTPKASPSRRELAALARL
ncbi:phytoene/squalene synthase family protein [Novosphingobium album (ex Liu et al. 2023)]|uniref:Phytoene/squalene synthase family protein n=1 Tax=Novosphingobium album (ex Liu et al. 2023) TaxID=3031130 RepID=A0ABT5WJQ6_9SPHN|nr:phytoene/squalene synthase family protein [Novosphingobium album (ex Liu et al. 2023)]MDE8650271.1 phytoene/squalene synthase family protein [Novosphingobium album (ex Liu et al. 2023)]